MMTERELYAIISRIPLDNEDRGKLYQYLIELGANGFVDVSEILKLIPAEASETNKLADKAFVESIVSPDAGTYISKDDSGVPFDSYDELIKYRGSVKNNDYALVAGRDSSNNEILIPYKATIIEGVAKWGKKYKEFAFVNNRFSEANFAALQSGINIDLVVRFITFIDIMTKIVPDDTTDTNKLTNEKYVIDATEEATDAEVNETLNS